MGRVNIEREELIQAWEELETAERIAEKFGCHFNTILNKSRRYGIPMKLGPKSKAGAMRSSVSRFFAKHKGPIPSSMDELVELSGCTEDAIRNYAYRRRVSAKQAVNQEPWRHNGKPVVWIDIGGRRIPDSAFDVVRAFISKWGSIKFEVRLKTGSVHVFKMTEGKFRRMYSITVNWNRSTKSAVGSNRSVGM